MRAVVQRVSRARVVIAGEAVAEIGAGLCVLVGVAEADGEGEAIRLADKVAHLRVFENDLGKFDLSLLETGGEALVVSQFTLLADTAKGNRPSFSGAALPSGPNRSTRRSAPRSRPKACGSVAGSSARGWTLSSSTTGP